MSIIQIWDVLRWSIVGDWAPTPFDLPNIWDLTDAEIEEYIRRKIKDDLSDPATFEKLTRVFQKSIRYLEEELFYTKSELTRLKKQQPFRDISDLIYFLRRTTSSTGRMNCVIAKVFQSFYDCDEEFNERIREIKEKTQWVIDERLMRPLRVLKVWEDEYSGVEVFRWENWQYREIPFKLKKRVKSTNSTVSKEIRDPKYFSIERTSDLHGLTFEVERKEDILPLMQMVAGYVFKKWEYEVKNDKGMFSYEEVEADTEISEEFKARVALWIDDRDKPESWDVQDIKLVTPKNKGEGIQNMNIEIKFTVVKNQNENGLNMHGVYNYAKKLKERIRLEWFVSHQYIDRVVDNFLENIWDLLASNVWRDEWEWDDTYPYKRELFNDLKSKNFIDASLNLRSSHVKSNIDRYLKQWLIQYYKSTLTPVTVNGWKKIYYTNKRGLEMSENGVWWDVLRGIQD